MLAEPARHALYDYVVAQPAEVSRDDAAEALGVNRSLAAFHLDKLVEAGLLEASYRRLSGRSGPGAGRPAKLYRRANRQLSVSLPPRRYDLAAELLATAVAAAPAACEALTEAARHTGHDIGAAYPGDRTEELVAVGEALRPLGYEPRVTDGGVLLANCPFHALAATHTALVCGANVALLNGLLDGLGARRTAAVLEPSSDRCCVVLRSKTSIS